jgi:hypothetical protein
MPAPVDIPQSSKVRENLISAPVSIISRASPTASPSLVSSHKTCTKPSPSSSRSTDEQLSPESCSSYQSSEEPRAEFTTVVLGYRTWASSVVLPCRFLARPSCGALRCRRTDARNATMGNRSAKPAFARLAAWRPARFDAMPRATSMTAMRPQADRQRSYPHSLKFRPHSFAMRRRNSSGRSPCRFFR